MKTKILYLPALLLVLLATACAGEDAGKNTPTTDPDLKGLTAFAIADNADPAGRTVSRTAGAYTGTRLDFYWTAEDKIWVTDDDGQLKQSQGDDIQQRLDETHTTITPKAKFLMPGKYGAAAAGYKVRYTGKNGLKDKVTIAATQTQTTPKDASHIGESGDCGIATATYNSSDGSYRFSLTHAAAYLTFMPFSSQEPVSTSCKVEKIKVSADQALCGQFDFTDTGIDIGTRPTPAATNQSIELNLNRFAIQTQAAATTDPKANAATMVIAPGQYTNFKIEYTLISSTNNRVTITKNYPNAKFLAGKNKPIKEDLTLGSGTSSSPYCVHVGDFGNWNHSNANVLFWYAQRGDAWWDADAEWAVVDATPQKKIYFGKGGVWIKSEGVIAQENSKSYLDLRAAAPDGVDNTSYNPYATHNTGYYPIPHQGRPPVAVRNKYFFLPAWGHNYNSSGGNYQYLNELGIKAKYWGDTTYFYDPAHGRQNFRTYYLEVDAVNIWVNTIYGHRGASYENPYPASYFGTEYPVIWMGHYQPLNL